MFGQLLLPLIKEIEILCKVQSNWILCYSLSFVLAMPEKTQFVVLSINQDNSAI
jgi:hypothetical protein